MLEKSTFDYPTNNLVYLSGLSVWYIIQGMIKYVN